MTTPHYHATVNMPGYLPEGDIAIFGTAEGAWLYLFDELERDWEAAADGSDESDDVNARYLEVDTAMHNHDTDLPGTVYLEGPTATHLGWAYSVSECSFKDCTETADWDIE